MTALNQKVLESINSELPAMVAGELKNFIADAEADKAALEKLRAEHQSAMAELSKFRAMENRELSVANRENNVAARESKMALEEAVHKVNLEHTNQRIQEIRGLVQTVFQSNRLDYNLNLGIPLKDQYGNTQYQNLTGTINKTP